MNRHSHTILRACLAAVLVLLAFGQTAALASYPPDPKADIPWAYGGDSTVAGIQSAFNNARSQENAQLGLSIPLLTLPTQATWDAKSDGEKVLWLVNRDRIDRNIMPLHGVESNVTSVAQTYAQYLLDHNLFSHDADGRTLAQRLDANPTIHGCWERVAENIAALYSGWNLPIERSVQMWTYDDSGSAWGHRHNNLYYPYNDNSGPSGKEGFIGVGHAHGTFQGYANSDVIVLDFFDPCPTWSYASETTPPTITSANSATFAIGRAGSFTVIATGDPAPALSASGALPSGVTFTAATGLLAGTPLAGTAGTYRIVLTASNGVLPNATQNFTLNITSGYRTFLPSLFK